MKNSFSVNEADPSFADGLLIAVHQEPGVLPDSGRRLRRRALTGRRVVSEEGGVVEAVRNVYQGVGSRVPSIATRLDSDLSGSRLQISGVGCRE